MTIFAFRVLNISPQPFHTLSDALEALYNDSSCMGTTAQIIAYYKNGTQLTVPNELYTHQEPRFKSVDEASTWLKDRNEKAVNGRPLGILVANPNDTFEKQLDDAMSVKDVRLINDKPVASIVSDIEKWLAKNHH
ncbi:hypothetical protein ACRN9Z_08635 [Shewanella frigidimarina]|uniref:hypothetical protein n=1 Tax=Shewanella frigidimarina TaxID=56812 RepID=UPI003D7B4354